MMMKNKICAIHSNSQDAHMFLCVGGNRCTNIRVMDLRAGENRLMNIRVMDLSAGENRLKNIRAMGYAISIPSRNLNYLAILGGLHSSRLDLTLQHCPRRHM